VLKKFIPWSFVVLGLSACGSSSSSSTSVPSEDRASYWITQITYDYSDCFEVLGVTEVPTYEENAGGSRPEGFMRVAARGVTLSFSVSPSPKVGNHLIVPDEATYKILYDSGCVWIQSSD
jgi:hypothetical protein